LNTRKIVITGGPGTGKTSIINALKTKEFHCFDEVIRLMTLEAKQKGNSLTHVSNPIAFVNDPMQFNINLLNARIEQFLQSNVLDKHISFFDRGIPDVLAYMAFFNQAYDTTFKNACETHVYDSVFLLPPWEAIYKSDNERFETFEEAVQIHDYLKQTYIDFNYKIVEVPFGTVEERSNFILNRIAT